MRVSSSLIRCTNLFQSIFSMRRFISFLIPLFFLSLSLLAQDKVKVHLKSGQVVEYALSEIDSLTFHVVPIGVDTDTISELGGRVARPVDLGLSVRWASHNAGAVSVYGNGSVLAFNAAISASNLWGEGWRLPTETEWQELLMGTSCKWVIRNGVAGRVFTADNGNSIFLPAVGFSLTPTDDTIHASVNTSSLSCGALGIYWSSSDAPFTSDQAKGLYMDSGNVFMLDFSKTLRCGVRLVKD